MSAERSAWGSSSSLNTWQRSPYTSSIKQLGPASIHCQHVCVNTQRHSHRNKTKHPSQSSAESLCIIISSLWHVRMCRLSRLQRNFQISLSPRQDWVENSIRGSLHLSTSVSNRPFLSGHLARSLAHHHPPLLPNLLLSLSRNAAPYFEKYLVM